MLSMGDTNSWPPMDYRQRETSPTTNRDGPDPLHFPTHLEVKIDRIYLLPGVGRYQALSPPAFVARFCILAALDAGAVHGGLVDS